MRLLGFWRKYKVYIIIGILVGLTLGLLFWVFGKKTPNMGEISLESINSPFEYRDEVVGFSKYSENIEAPSKANVYKTTIPDFKIVDSFVKRFSDVNPNISTDAYMWNFSGSVITYSVDTSLLFVTSQKGLVTDIKIGTKSDVESFLLDYLGIDGLEITDSQELGDGRKEYMGYFVSDPLQYGSLYLDGYALKMIADNSKIYSLSLLMLSNDNVSQYQQMPTTTLSSVLSNNHERYVEYKNYDENFKRQYPIIQASAKLKSVEVNTTTYKYVFLTNEYRYIVPVYQMDGNGLLVDSQSKEYRTSVLVSVCALDSTYLKRVEPALNDEVLIDSGE